MRPRPIPTRRTLLVTLCYHSAALAYLARATCERVLPRSENRPSGSRPCLKGDAVSHAFELFDEASLVGVLGLALDKVVAAKFVVGL
jgi:hypothetical protein